MATERTPTYKRVKRAEEGRDDWKLKATLRREENEKLTKKLIVKEEQFEVLASENNENLEKLNTAHKRIAQLEKQVELLKKSPQ
jgi:hypothetical protein